ncbi:hypothetical protein AAFF_G00415900 [Aldrovandia affinis]|uniref:C-type lectin domain-containing protein n=1 Tax=Aldrovandia affinis TaxID=143900 RepID=A0AAD7SAV6_9TELE|nr:hypothetical protein AAFF_G00415900 [Aldrovandia affinis]
MLSESKFEAYSISPAKELSEGSIKTHTMRALIISVLLYMVLAPSGATEGANVAQAEASVPVNDANPPAEETVPEALVENLLSFPEPLDGAYETPLTQSLGECPFGWHGHQARCYHFVNQANTWIEAQQYCIGIGANLASARNPRDYKFLQDMVHKLGGSSSAWLGGFYLQVKVISVYDEVCPHFIMSWAPQLLCCTT